ncbi:MAG: putative ABC transporter permease [Treponema sp.]|nr:putative ABC transporter permease [Treponema sp.]
MDSSPLTMLVLYFTIYGMAGWIIESAFCSISAHKPINRGFLSGPWCPAYGFGALLILLFSEPFKTNILLVFVIAFLTATMFEYFTGWLLETLFKTRWWDYSKNKLNIKGRICLKNSLFFGVMGLAVVYILHPFISGLMLRLTVQAQSVLSSLIISLFFFDLIRSLASATKLGEHFENIRKELELMVKYQHRYNWYVREDTSGNLERLRSVCVNNPEDQEIAAILARVEKHFTGGGIHLRLLKAFPGLKFKSFSPGIGALRQKAEERREEHRIHSEDSFGTKVAALKKEILLSYEGITVTNMVWVFLLASVIGFVVETLFCFVTKGIIQSRQGMIYGPFNQVYGFGAVLLVLILMPLARKRDLWLFIGGAVLGGFFEAACSAVQESVFGSVSWQYSSVQVSLFGGRTSLMYMCFWGIMTLLYMKHIFPGMSSLIDHIPWRAKHFFTWIIVVVLCTDMALSALAVNRWSQRNENVTASNGFAVWLDDNYPDELMGRIYPSMKFVSMSESDGKS